ncbi:hypothetical protein HDU76_003857, partial [Blyttiomyces sp. JEL0837]
MSGLIYNLSVHSQLGSPGSRCRRGSKLKQRMRLFSKMHYKSTMRVCVGGEVLVVNGFDIPGFDLSSGGFTTRCDCARSCASQAQCEPNNVGNNNVLCTLRQGVKGLVKSVGFTVGGSGNVPVPGRGNNSGGGASSTGGNGGGGGNTGTGGGPQQTTATNGGNNNGAGGNKTTGNDGGFKSLLSGTSTFGNGGGGDGSTRSETDSNGKVVTPSSTQTGGQTNVGLSGNSTGNGNVMTVVAASIGCFAGLIIAVGILVWIRRRKWEGGIMKKADNSKDEDVIVVGDVSLETESSTDSETRDTNNSIKNNNIFPTSKKSALQDDKTLQMEKQTKPTTTPNNNPPTSDLDTIASPNTAWLPDLNPEIQRAMYNKITSGTGTDTTTPNTVTRISNGIDNPFVNALIPKSLYLNGGDGENGDGMVETNLVRYYGHYSGWDHELVVRWARLKRLEEGVVDILKKYHIDGPVLSTFSSTSNIEQKFVIEYQGLLEKLIAAVESLRNSIDNGIVDDGVEGGGGIRGPNENGGGGDGDDLDNELPRYPDH